MRGKIKRVNKGKGGRGKGFMCGLGLGSDVILNCPNMDTCHGPSIDMCKGIDGSSCTGKNTVDSCGTDAPCGALSIEGACASIIKLDTPNPPSCSGGAVDICTQIDTGCCTGKFSIDKCSVDNCKTIGYLDNCVGMDTTT